MGKNDERIKAYKESSKFETESSVFLDFNNTLNKALYYVLSKVPVVLFGPPGTGKTYIIEKIKTVLSEQNKLGKFDLVQFHKKFSYEDFIEGFAPNEMGTLSKKDGIFKSFCKGIAENDPLINLFIIDELNRAELSTTLGEVLYLLEERDVRKAKTSHFGEEFYIPPSVSILGTMNTADRNISSIDFAIRRRFRFIPLFPDYTVLKEVLLLKGWSESELSLDIDSYCKAAERINIRIAGSPVMGRHMQLGHMMFVPTTIDSVITKEELLEQFIYVILPQLEAYCGFGNEKLINEIIGGNITYKYLNNRHIMYGDIESAINDIANSKEDGPK